MMQWYFPRWRMYERGPDGKCVHHYLTVRAFTAKEARALFKRRGFTGGRLRKYRPDARYR